MINNLFADVKLTLPSPAKNGENGPQKAPTDTAKKARGLRGLVAAG